MAFFAAFRRDLQLQDVTFTQIMTFTRLLSLLKHDITLSQPASICATTAPSVLPPDDPGTLPPTAISTARVL
ncbi:hypothetical protein B0H17DRAFT_1193183 [Mycena rosella]|uniref:Uncharacterized protein n=1 Tax=Mycena rosella TaxID=1033263 RepID=A0AAD7GUD1_MYCRO|nr:hypothetical protein B0H17DRAFT_1193183 [Mycena rosella]